MTLLHVTSSVCRRVFGASHCALPLTIALVSTGTGGCASHGPSNSSDESTNGTASDGAASGTRSSNAGASGGSSGSSGISSSSSVASGGDSGSKGGTAGDAGSEQGDATIEDAGGLDASDGACVPNLQCKPPPPDSGNYYADCVDRVNQFRACVCQPPIARWTAGETCANEEAQHDEMVDAAHAGFEANLCSPEGNGECECPGYPSEPSIISLCLQQMFNEGPPAAGSYNHFSIMTASTATMVACGIYTDSKGTVWALQNYQE